MDQLPLLHQSDNKTVHIPMQNHLISYGEINHIYLNLEVQECNTCIFDIHRRRTQSLRILVLVSDSK